MAQFIHVKGDVTEPSTYIPNYPINKPVNILQQVNCIGIMGGGVALSIANKFPIVKQAYLSHCNAAKERDISLFGTMLVTVTEDQSINVINLFGQFNTNTVRDTNYEAIYNALSCVANLFKSHSNHVFAIPKNMSSGLAGGNWNIIFTMIQELFKDLPNTVYIVEFDGGTPCN